MIFFSYRVCILHTGGGGSCGGRSGFHTSHTAPAICLCGAQMTFLLMYLLV